MNLRDRLRSMGGVAPRAPTADVAPAPPLAPPGADVVDAPPQRSPADAHRPVPRGHSPETLLPGRERMTPFGACFVAEWRYPLRHQHGHRNLERALDILPGDGAALLVRTRAERHALAEADPYRVAYLDTETTGLAGGTGTYAFLIGVGRVYGEDFIVRQIFMRDFHEEGAALHVLAEELAGCPILVTYNGKAFDWPLLDTRYTLARRGGPARPADPLAHVDLLFAARRLWRARLESCSLGQVEQAILGVRRGDDTPGWLIPQLYFAYLRDRDVRPLAGVFRHNVLDILSMAGLLGHVAEIARAGERAEAAHELLALGRCFEEADDCERALACYTAAAQRPTPAHALLERALAREARLRAAALLKRGRRSVDAVAHWHAVLAMEDDGRAHLRALVELAKHYEHAAREHILARDYTLRALEALHAAGTPPAPRDRAELLHRLRRLERLLGTGQEGM
jgi:uncharacterized protein YprB with RNaseH-like and TPR domain